MGARGGLPAGDGTAPGIHRRRGSEAAGWSGIAREAWFRGPQRHVAASFPGCHHEWISPRLRRRDAVATVEIGKEPLKRIC